VLARLNVELIAALGASVCASRDVAAGGNWIRHVHPPRSIGEDVPDARRQKRQDANGRRLISKATVMGSQYLVAFASLRPTG
jgi:hypothetical protein